MRIDEQLKMLCVKSGLSLAEMARRLNKTPQAFNQKMKRGTFSVEELEKIGEALGAKYFFGYEFEDGTKI